MLTGRLLQRNGAAAATWWAGFVGVGVAVTAGTDVVAIGEATVAGGVGDGAAAGVGASLQAPSAAASVTAMAAVRIVPTGLA